LGGFPDFHRPYGYGFVLFFKKSFLLFQSGVLHGQGRVPDPAPVALLSTV
jgi:hypothetical protein